ncbi:LysR family transcriptional regulator [Paracoccus suum]|uniref:LysR family transcriptional regulator n=1 Tax=Paracoccus suum TaxID=2259340 RepID=A0A344PNJ7_9RHOB|nr:LysR family transcriptional regulator [Paracoccus suum]AXC50952.1 LysR family transcriptional regulator [Paracoccus suum]
MPLRFTLRQLEYLVAVGEAGSVTHAAQRLNVSAPSVSAAIAQLEAEFGLPLFVRRHAQGVAPTQAGRRFVDEARAVLHQAARLSDLAADVTSQVRGPLAVGCMTTLAQIVLPQLRRSFADRYPQVEFHQSEGSQAVLIEGLRAATVDIALSFDIGLPVDLAFSPLVSLPPYAVMAPDHPLAARASVAVEDLAVHPMVLLDLPISAEYFMSFFTNRGLRPVIGERTRDLALMQSLVANGFGYSIGNIRPASTSAPDGKPLCFVPLTGPVPRIHLGLTRVAGRVASRTVRAFVEHAQERISAETAPGLILRPRRPGDAG